jgi:hypothetical protein
MFFPEEVCPWCHGLGGQWDIVLTKTRAKKINRTVFAKSVFIPLGVDSKDKVRKLATTSSLMSFTLVEESPCP